MLPAFITIGIIAIVLIILSFFMNDRIKELEKQFEQFSIGAMQDTYQIRKKIKLLEEEMLLDNFQKPAMSGTTNRKPTILQDVLSFYEQGFSFEEIARRTSLSASDVQDIIRTNR
ncbi:hypothetical protein QR721_07825 [Aciduricibacillus chroicocephali]|uniref:Resolvase HTH domain-containing protein n=1 Tax=Aciduricibacillus chroicocephali TaxID=3054939 RepID=A0ABY9KRN4_9BACI|nr:hypothetical protein QR721_07825 [Bacillaceae bacterium 44XB]